MIYEHWSDMPWDKDRWPNFTAAEVSCRHCGESYYDPLDFDMLQALRTNLGSAVDLNCGHRCEVHNILVGGAPLSQHWVANAWDISIHRTDPAKLFAAASQAGYTTFGFYGTFMHTDLRPGRRWATKQGKVTWNFLGI